MPIQDGDIKLLASERMTDNTDGGGRVTGNVILDGVSNNIFPDIAELDRTYGRVNLRKVFPAAHTDDTDGYYGAHVILADAPDDPLVSAAIFTTRDWTDDRANAVDRLEAYLARGPRFEGYLYDQHISGQRAIILLMRTDRDLPAVGTTLSLVKNPGQQGEDEQYVRITGVSAVTRSFSAAGCASDFLRQVVTVEISDPLSFDLAGGQPSCTDDVNQTIASKVYTTRVADAAQYYGVRPMVEAALTGALSVRADTIYVPLVPSAQTEIPITDAKPHGDAVLSVPVGGDTATISTSVAFDPTHALYLGQGVYPGTLVLSGGGYTLVDQNGKLMSGTQEVGLVDYSNGILTLSAGGPSIGGGKLITFRPAASPARNMQTASWAVTPESRSATIVALLDPVAAPGTLAVHYMAQGKWYVLRDSGGGQLRGSDAAYGAGVINFVTGSVVVTLGALPDVGTKVLFTYGVAALEIDRSGAAPMAYQKIVLDTENAIVPSGLTVEWDSGAMVATDDGNGNLTGDAVGTVNYADRTIYFSPLVLPAGGSQIDVVADTQIRSASDVITPSVGGGLLAFTLTNPPVEKTLSIDVPVRAVVTGVPNPWTQNGIINLRDDGLGNIKLGSSTVGSVNYISGDVSINDAYTLSGQVPETNMANLGYDSYATYRYVISRYQSQPLHAPFSGPTLTAAYMRTGAPSTLPVQSFTWTPIMDLTVGHNESIVPGSVRVAFAGKTLLDRNGQMVMDLDPASGSATQCGTIDYQTGVAQVAGAAIPGQDNAGSVIGLLTTLYGHPVDEVTFRTAAAPLRPGSLILQFARATGGGTVTVTAQTDGTITGTDIIGTIDYQTGIVRARFGRWVAAAGNESEPWYLPEAVVNGQIFRPEMVIGETLRYAAVAYVYIPLDADILGLNPVRLPSDGRVPVFAVGRVAVVHHTQTTVGTWANTNVVDLGRDRIARVRVLDDNGAVVDSARYSTDLDAGELTWLDVSGLVQPLTIEDRIEDMGLISDAQINGQITLTRPLTHDYPAPGALVSSALIVGDMAARYATLFEQATWTGVWSDVLIGSEPTASYNEIQYPVLVTNRGAIQEQWALIFTSTTAFRVVGKSVGEIATGNTATDLAPANPSTGAPYFTLRALGWGAGWSAGNVLRFNTIAANFPVWIARTIRQGPATAQNDSFTLQIRGDIDA